MHSYTQLRWSPYCGKAIFGLTIVYVLRCGHPRCTERIHQTQRLNCRLWRLSMVDHWLNEWKIILPTCVSEFAKLKNNKLPSFRDETKTNNLFNSQNISMQIQLSRLFLHFRGLNIASTGIFLPCEYMVHCCWLTCRCAPQIKASWNHSVQKYVTAWSIQRHTYPHVSSWNFVHWTEHVSRVECQEFQLLAHGGGAWACFRLVAWAVLQRNWRGT